MRGGEWLGKETRESVEKQKGKENKKKEGGGEVQEKEEKKNPHSPAVALVQVNESKLAFFFF